MSRKKQVQKKQDNLLPDDYESLKAIADDADKYHALKTVLGMEGGQILIDSLISDVINGVDRLVTGYKEYSRDELVSIIARLEVNLNLSRALARSDENLKDADERLNEALRE